MRRLGDTRSRSVWDEHLRPPVQLADPVPRRERRWRRADLDLAILPNAHTEAPGSLARVHPPTFAITPEHVGERSHDRAPRTSRRRYGEGRMKRLAAELS